MAFWFDRLTPAEAREYCDAFAALGPTRLAELSSWVRETGGPWDELDASLASLVPLWGWFVRFAGAGCPGVRAAPAVHP